MTKEEFIKEVTQGLLPPPAYFPLNVALNKEGYKSIDEVIKTGAKGLSVNDFEFLANETDAVIIDVRHQFEFVKGFIPQSIFIGLGGTFAPWVGALVKDIHQPILLVVPDHMEKETITRLSRVGFDNVLGYLSGGFEAWKISGKEIDTLPSVSANVLEQQIDKDAIVFDVRRPGEYEAEHIENVPSTPLDFINDHISEFPTNKDFYVHCAGGYRSVIAASILKAEKETITRLSRVGFDNVLGYLSGGFEAWKTSGKEIDTLPSVPANVLEQQIDKDAFVFDVRRPGEYEAEHIENVPSTPLDFLNDHISEFPTNKDFYVHCAGGYRSVIAASILKARGYSKVIDVAGGYGAIKKTNIKRTQVTACSNSK